MTRAKVHELTFHGVYLFFLGPIFILWCNFPMDFFCVLWCTFLSQNYYMMLLNKLINQNIEIACCVMSQYKIVDMAEIPVICILCPIFALHQHSMAKLACVTAWDLQPCNSVTIINTQQSLDGVLHLITLVSSHAWGIYRFLCCISSLISHFY